MMSHRPAWSLTVALALAAFLAGCSGGNSTATGRVDGYVFASAAAPALTMSKADGDVPLAGAQVSVQGLPLGTQTNDSGYFLLAGVPVGPRTLVISYPGYQSIAASVTVEANTTVRAGESVLRAAERRWTILVFMNADNDLEPFGIQDMNELEAALDSDQVAVLVQMDRTPGYDTSNGNWTGTRRFRVQHDDDPALITSPVLEDMGEVDMGQPEALRDFIAWGKALYPAEHYLVDIWNHGSGWRSRAETCPVTRGVSFDDSSGTYVRTVALPGALATSPPVDLVAFDASLMQMIEIAYEMRDSCRYIVGSEESPPGAGYAYDTWLRPLVESPGMSPSELGVAIARETLAYYGTSSDITQSVLDTSKLEGLATAVDTFARALMGVALTYDEQLAAARGEAESFAFIEYKDLYHYAGLVKGKVAAPGVRAAAGQVMAAVTDAVVASYHGDFHPNAHGVSIFVPTQTGYARVAPLYAPLAFAERTQWDEWLNRQRL